MAPEFEKILTFNIVIVLEQGHEHRLGGFALIQQRLCADSESADFVGINAVVSEQTIDHCVSTRVTCQRHRVHVLEFVGEGQSVLAQAHSVLSFAHLAMFL